MTSATAEAEKRDAQKTDGFEPSGGGYRFVSALTATVEKTAGKNVSYDQFHKTFQAWCSLLAQNAVGSDKAVSADEQAEPKASVEHGTDLSKLVDANKIVRPAPIYYSDAEGLDKTPGVLRLELGLHIRGNLASLYVKSARLEGLNNDDFASDAGRVPLKDLDMPIVAQFNDDEDSGFVVGRNEVQPRDYWGSTTGKDILTQRYKGSAKDAAKRILEDELGSRNVGQVKRG
jgi:hypothetical protein